LPTLLFEEYLDQKQCATIVMKETSSGLQTQSGRQMSKNLTSINIKTTDYTHDN
jgi:hypothetical protein